MIATRELENLRALEVHGAFNTQPEPVFDRITALAANLFDAPIALITLIDGDRQWLKSHHGLDASAATSARSFASLCLDKVSGPMVVVADASRNPRFLDHPLVTAAPQVRFYVGARLTFEDGRTLGTLSVMDHRARPDPTEVELERLQTLAALVVDHLVLARDRRLLAADRKILDLSEAMFGVGHWRYDVRTAQFDWSDELFRIYGQTRETFDPNRDSPLQFHTPSDRDRLVALLRSTIAEKSGYECQVRIYRADGVVREVTTKAVCELNPLGEVVGVLGVSQDVTDQEAYVRDVRKSQSEYRLLADHVDDVISRLRIDGTCEYLSPAVERLLGRRACDIVADGGSSFIHDDDLPQVLAGFAAMMNASDHQTLQYRMKHVEGDLVWVESNIRLLRDEAGAPREMVMVTRDIRERRRLEEQLRAALARAEASVEAKTEFLANMSHEIRTPLTAIIGFSDLLSGCSGLPSQAEHYVRRIQTAGIGLLSVVNDILDFSKLEAGHVELDPRSFEPLAFVEETLELVEAQAANKGLCVRFAPAGDIPEWVLADSSRLRQILLNLLTNAIKFTSKGGVEVGMTYSAHADGVLRIEVTDTGPGVPSAQRSRLFQRFSQGDSSTSRRHGGTGLGLAICKSLAELMGGSIGVKSRVGRGSTFWFTVRAPIAQPALSLAPDPPVRAEERPERPARILLVDDVAANREVAIALLSPFGHEFAEAQNGADAVGLAMKTPFDLILMDLNMPGMDGLAAARAIRASSEVNGRTPILALSANVRDVEVKACRAAGMSDHIAKPIAVQDLLCKVAQWLDADAAA